MRINRSRQQYGCYSRCGCCTGCGNRWDSAFNPYWVTYQRRFLDVPMRVFNGAGYSSQDALESIADALHTISDNGDHNDSGTRNNDCGWNNRGCWNHDCNGNNCRDWRSCDSRNDDCGCRSTYSNGCGCC